MTKATEYVQVRTVVVWKRAPGGELSLVVHRTKVMAISRMAAWRYGGRARAVKA